MSLGPVFRTWLDNAVVPEVKLSPEEEQRLQEARETIRAGADLYHQYELRWQEAQVAWQAAIRLPLTDPDRPKLILARKLAAENAMRDWQVRGRKSSFESAVALTAFYLLRGLKHALAALRESYDKIFDMNCTQHGEHFTPVKLIPRELFEGAATWTSVSIRTDELSARQETTGTMHNGGLDMPLFWIGDSGCQRVRVDGIDTSKMVVAFEFAQARIDRSDWFDSFLLTSNSWWWKGATRSDPFAGGIIFSNGALPPNTQGQWQMIPTGIIFTRNLVVDTGPFQLVASEFVSRARASPMAGFWIFTARSTVGSPLANDFDFDLEPDSILRVPQMQIAAVVCQLMPKEPNPDPALLPEEPG